MNPPEHTDNILNRIDSPADLKRLSLEELQELAENIREKIIETVSIVVTANQRTCIWLKKGQTGIEELGRMV